MQHKTFLCILFLILPTFFIGQVLEEIDNNPSGLPDPDKFPFGLYFKIGVPAGSFAHQFGHGNIQQIIEESGLELDRDRSVSIYEVGARYKRLYLEFGVGNQQFSSPLLPSKNDRFAINSTHMMAWMNMGFSVWQNRNSAILLRAGVGSMGTTYTIRSLANVRQVDFDNLLTEGGAAPATIIHHENSFLDIGIEFWKGRAKSRTSLGEAVRIGYRRGFKETPWETLDTPSINAPLDRISEIYLHVCFHLGPNFPSKSK